MKTLQHVLTTVLMLLCAVRASAVTLEWKFTPGEVQNYRLTQSARLSAGPADALKQFTSVKQEIDLTWKVVEVSDEGNATISLAVTAFSFLATGPDGQEVRYDSQSTEEPQGYAAMLLPIGKRLAEAEVQLTMTPRGEVSDVKLPEELAEAVKSIPSGKKFAQDGGVTSFESMARLGAPLLFPTDDVTTEKSWTEKRELELPVFGKVTVAFAFEVKDPPTENKVTIDQQMTIEAESAKGVERMNLTNQKSTGKIEFDFVAGRPELSTLTYEAELEQPTHVEGHMKLEHTIEYRRLVDDSQ